MIESSAPGPFPFLRALIAAVACAAALAAVYLLGAGGPASGGQPDGVSASPSKSYGDLPLSFEAGAGRYSNVDFLSNSAAGTVAVGPQGLRFAQAYGSERHPRSAAIDMALPGASLTRPSGLERLPGVVNDLRGAPADRLTGIPTFARVGYDSVWPGVDLLLRGREGSPEYDFRLAAGADPAQISLKVEGADSITVSRSGDLLINVGGAVFRERAPVAYQPAANGRRPVDAGFALAGNTVSFDLGAYDTDLPLVIDPVTIAYSTYLGGDSFDAASGIAVDAAGAAYISGQTSSTDFNTVGPIQGPALGTDAFVSKLNPAGSALVYSTYLGGSAGNDTAGRIAVDPSGAAYVAGTTGSNDFPTTAGSFQTAFGGLVDAFVAKLNPAGSALVYSTYLGGPDVERGGALALDSTGAVYVAGDAAAGFPTTGGAFQTSLDGTHDGFVSKLNATGSALVYSTYLGGSGDDEPVGSVAVDSTGAAYAAGFTNSTDFPTVNPIQTNSADYDGYVSKLNPAGSALAYSTYLGGNGLDNIGAGLAVDSNDAAYVVGNTQSSDYPAVNEIEGDGPGADGVVTKINPAGTAFDYSTYLGGSGFDWMTAVKPDGDGSAWIGGYSDSSDFDTLNPIEGDSPGFDGVVANLGADGALRFSTLIGGDGDDLINAIALGADGLYASGYTTSSDYDTVGPIEGDGPGTDAVITKLGFDTTGPQTTIDSGPPDGSTITDRTPTFGFSADEDGATFECSVVPAGQPAVFGPCSGPGATHTPGSDLADGGYVFAVRATDAFGNVDASPAATIFTVASPAVMPKCLGLTATVVTSDGDDDVAGTPGDDVIVGRGGNDRIRGYGGADLLCGRSGDDRIFGGGGDDRLRGGVQAGKDHDVIRGGGGADRIFGFAGDEKLAGGAGPDHINGGGGADRLRGQAGGDDLLGGPGGDSLNGGTQSDRCVGGPGRDRNSNCERKGPIGQSH